jgi:hypothetical protein
LIRLGVIAGLVIYFLLNFTTRYLEETYLSNDRTGKNKYQHSIMQDYDVNYQPIMIASNLQVANSSGREEKVRTSPLVSISKPKVSKAKKSPLF